MMPFRRFASVLLAVLAGLILPLAATPVSADEMAFYMRNTGPRAVAIELYSQSGRGQVWPGDDKVYLLDAQEKKSVQITCEAGEEICFGSWLFGDASTFTGVGMGNLRACTDCCAVCVSEATETIDVAP